MVHEESEITDIDADEFDDLVEQAQNQDTYDAVSYTHLDVYKRQGHEEYRYNIGPIEHDPFILISYLSAKYEELSLIHI